LVPIFVSSIILPLSLLDFSTYGQEQQLIEYRDPQGRFTILYPALWTISPIPESNRFEENPFENIAVEFKGAEGSWKSFNVVIRNLTDASTDLRTLSEAEELGSVVSLPEGLQEIPTECEKYKIQGNQACSFIISSKPNPIIDRKMIMMQVMSVINGTEYALSYGNTPSDFDKELPMIDKMIASFKLMGN
jgi:hypothetical protein